jgi:mono/diheme cytochrome c family protein
MNQSRNVKWRRPTGNGYRQTGLAILAALAISIPGLGLGAAVIYSGHSARASAAAAAEDRLHAHEVLLASAALPMVDEALAGLGRQAFVTSCATCHGRDGQGVPGLGKALTDSWFVASLDDETLSEFLAIGRTVDHPLNTTRMPMPAKGGNDDLNDDDLRAIVAYMRGLQDPRRMPELGELVIVNIPPSADEMAKALAAAGGDEELAEWIASGSKLFAGSCSACHGKDARGVQGSGKTLVNNPFCDNLDDEELLAFIKRGRDPGDPANTTGVGMPAKGGNPALDDDDILDIIAYLRSLG